MPGWDNQKAGTIFEQMLVKTNNKIEAVAAANDGLANAVVVALKSHKLKPIPLSGQDATTQGAQNIISGWQTMTVWKDVASSRPRRRQAAIRIAKGQKPPTTGMVKTKGRGEGAGLPDPAAVDHEGELAGCSSRARLPEEERRLQRRVQEVLLADAATEPTEAPLSGRLRRLCGMRHIP